MILEWLFSPQPPGGTVGVMLIAMVISLINSGIYRLLINRLVGFREYKKLQKELKKLQKEFQQILRSKDKEALQKFEKKRKRMLQIQAKIMKPQSYLFLIGFSYIIIWWLLLIPIYGNNPLATIPGINLQLHVVWWYFLCSALFGTLFYRVFGIVVEEGEE